MITAQVESFVNQWEELKPLLPLHWEELAVFKDRMPLDVDFAFYAGAESRGELLFIAVREAGKLVGYFVGTLGHSPHYKSTRLCKMDVIYLVPEHRGAGAGRLLLDTIRAELKRLGISLWAVGSKNHKPIEALFSAYGFEPIETYYAMWVE